MEKFLRKLIKLLKQEFPGAVTDIEETVPGHKVGGFLIWKGFEEMDQVGRQERVWEVLDAKFSKDERRQINSLLTMTPEEMAFARGT